MGHRHANRAKGWNSFSILTQKLDQFGAVAWRSGGFGKRLFYVPEGGTDGDEWPIPGGMEDEAVGTVQR